MPRSPHAAPRADTAARTGLWQRLSRGQTLGAWLAELLRFVGVGGIAYVADIGLFNLLVYGPGPLTAVESHILLAKTVSAAVAIVLAWLGNRLWTFRGRASRRPWRELAAFVLINLIALGVTVGTLAVALRLGFTTAVAVNIAGNIVGVGLGTLVRYLCYRYLLFIGDGAGVPQ